MAQKPIIIFKAMNFNAGALLGEEGAGTLEAGTVGGETKAEEYGEGEEATGETLSTLISTFCPA